MDKHIGFIGCGKMAQAMIEGMIKENLVHREQISASAITEETIVAMKEKLNILMTNDNKAVAAKSDVLFLAVKPAQYENVIDEIKDAVRDTTIIVTIAAGISLAVMEASFQRPVKVVRTMPNTPSLVGEGMSALCPNTHLTAGDLHVIETIFNSFGKTEVIPEELMDAIPAVSGSSPAYAYMFIEAMADGAVQQGIPRKQAYNLAAQAMLGAAKMVLETGEHPGYLKDDVCTPGGATIAAVNTLEKSNFRGSIMQAMAACTAQSQALSKTK
ncbi:pyrroline-5-carboxylate reductase [Thalassobacillus hwangdonensis]|uniref:Pyrroline-5-carboxylate reductase n=1 Tax=Thalassobacillus hwangdonensis TaxID=546108 RepID=A0ABW3KXD6_9BACI